MNAQEYENQVWGELENSPKFHESKPGGEVWVALEWTSGIVLGKVIRYLGFSDFWKCHKYDVMGFDGKPRLGVFEWDMTRICYNGSTQAANLKGWTKKCGC